MNSWMTGAFGRSAAIVALLSCAVRPADADELDRYIRNRRALDDVPAVVVGLYRDGRLVDVRAQGSANLELRVPVRADHVFEIGSISKQFTAHAILMLAERGRLDVDAPVGRYLDELPSDWGRVSLRQLLTHTSGLPDLEEAFGYGIYRETPTDADFLARLTALPREFEPGEKWSYCNTNYWLLARVIETLSGRSYAGFMQEQIFTPLGMRATRAALPATLLPGRAAGYRRVGRTVENRDPIQPSTGRGLGDIVSNLADMARWEREQLSPTLVSAASLATARQPVRLNDGSTAPYGFGWFIDQLHGQDTLQHEGQTAGFTAAYVRVPNLRLATVVLTNAYNAPVDSIARRALRHAAPRLRLPPPRPLPDTVPDLTRRIRDVLRTPATAWPEEWFGADFWRERRPWLGEIAEAQARLGPPRAVTLVGLEHEGSDRQVTCLVRYETLSRVLRYRFDPNGRITDRKVVDD